MVRPIRKVAANKSSKSSAALPFSTPPAPNPDSEDAEQAPAAAAASAPNSNSTSTRDRGKSAGSLPPKKASWRHSLKHKRVKAAIVSEHRPRTHEQRDALVNQKKPGEQPTLFGYLSLPHGRPKSDTPNTAAAVQPPPNPAPAPAPAPKKRGTIMGNGTRTNLTRELKKWQ